MIGRFIILTWLVLFGFPGWAQATDPSCQIIRLRGHLGFPEGKPPPGPVELTAFYQMNFQTRPALLFANAPLTGERFEILLSSRRDFGTPPPPKDWIPVKNTREKPQSLSAEPPLEDSPPQEPVQQFRFYFPLMFVYPREIKFQLYAKAGNWEGPLRRIDYIHEGKEVEGVKKCESEIEVPNLAGP